MIHLALSCSRFVAHFVLVISEGFLKYVRKEHKDAFNEFCYEFTGKSRK